MPSVVNINTGNLSICGGSCVWVRPGVKTRLRRGGGLVRPTPTFATSTHPAPTPQIAHPQSEGGKGTGCGVALAHGPLQHHGQRLRPRLLERATAALALKAR